MSRPRKPFGTSPPGRLPATMVKVLAAELSEQGRLARGKRYWTDNAVVDIVVGHGSVTAEIQGSRPQSYVVTIEAAPGAGVPGKRDVWIRCTCPDDSGTGVEACKHAVAALFALSDEIAVDPELVERWRSGSGTRRPRRPAPEVADEHDDEPPRVLAEVVPLRRPSPAPPPAPVEVDPSVAALSRLLAAPGGVLAPELPEVAPIVHPGIRDPDLAALLDDALDHLALNWD